jgi:4-hydroxy-3-polyprenylbenzoate decarboxylase
MFKNLREFLDALDRAGEIRRIDHEVSPYLEISRTTDEESKKPGGGKGLLFERVENSRFPVATNIFGSFRRVGMALGVDHLDKLGERVREYIDFHPPGNLREAFNVLPMAVEATRFFPRKFRGRTPPCQEVVLTGDQVDLGKLPVLTTWPKDGGPFITLPLVITRSLATGKRNVGMYRLQVFDRNTTGMHWHVHKDGSHYYTEYSRAEKRMPVAVAIGCDPATTFAATAPLPRGVDELMLAGFIRKKPVPIVRGVTVDLDVPAEAEFVLEGYVDPGELRREGPFGDHTGYYSLADDYPVFHVTAVTHRRNPVYNATLVGPPPMEDCYLAKATERLFLPMLQAVFPEIMDYWLPWEGVFHNIVVVSIDKAYPGHAQKVMSGLWGQGQMSFCKIIVLVDRDVRPQDPKAVLGALVRNLDLTTDLTFSKGILDVLDHSSPHANFGNKMGVDLTRRDPGEPPREPAGAPGPAPDAETLDRILRESVPGALGGRPLLADLVKKAEGEGAEGTPVRFLAIRVEKAGDRGGAEITEAVFAAETLRPFTVILLYDPEIDLTDGSKLLWKLFNNVDPGRDLRIQGGRAVIDASRKGPMDGHTREWPEELTFEV